jgi:hypothetical protein
MSATPTFVASYASQETQILNQYGAGIGVPIWTAGVNGSRIHAIACANDDTNTPTLTLYRGSVLSTNAAAGMAITTSTITRTSGSFVADGWLANNRVFVMNETNNLANQIVQPLSSVAAGTLTFSGTPLHTDASPPTSLQLVRASLLWALAVVAGAGNTSAVPAQNVLQPSQYPSFYPAPDTFLMLGPNEILIAVLSGTVTALKSVDIIVDGGNY